MQKTAVSHGKIKMLGWGGGLVTMLTIWGVFVAQECTAAVVGESAPPAYTAPDPLDMCGGRSGRTSLTRCTVAWA